MTLYRTIVADPPWPISWSTPATRVNGRGERHANKTRTLAYPTLSVAEIAALPVADLADAAAHLYLWTTERHLLEGDAARVARAWGFDRLRTLIWRKTGFGLGTFPRPQHETVVIGVRGSLEFAVKNAGSVHDWKLPYADGARVHSRKPDGFLDLVERASPGPYLELFARRQRLGWATWGDQALEHVQLAPSSPQEG